VNIRWLRRINGVGRQHGDYVVDATGDAAIEIAGLEPGRDGVGDDDF
jgi:hypothetical protein